MRNALANDAIKTIRATAEDMGQDAKFKVRFEEYPSSNEDDLHEWENVLREELGDPEYGIPDELKAIYSECGGFVFQWQYREPDQPALGSSNIVSLVELYQTDEEADRPMSAIYNDNRKFDIIGEDEYVAITFRKFPTVSIKMVWIDEESGRSDELKLNPIEYLSMLAKYRAIYHWQSLFLENKTPDPAFLHALANNVDRLFGPAALRGNPMDDSI
jgi:hypothetical protein